MKVIVQNATVSKNLGLFREEARRFLEQKRSEEVLGSRGVVGFVHCSTGEIYFGESVQGARDQWKKIFLRMSHEGDFLVLGVDEALFSLEELSAHAYQTMVDTVRVINLVLQLLQGRLDLGQLLTHLSSLEMAVSRDIIHEAWHQVDRLGAEALLEQQPKGTYLFRKDVYALLLEEQLRRRYKMPIKCITLSYLGRKGQVIEMTVVKREDFWLFYDDDPTLERPVYRDIHALLDTLEDDLRLPLLSA